MKNQVICKHDLVRFSKQTDLVIMCDPKDYGLLQLVKLQLKNPTEYRPWDWRVNDNALRTAMVGATVTLPLPSGTELKFHNVKNPTMAECYVRSPEVVVAAFLGLDMAKRAEKKAVKDIAKHFGRISVDITKFQPGTFQIIPDPKSKVNGFNKRLGGTLFGRPADPATLAPGKSYLCCKKVYVYELNRDDADKRFGQGMYLEIGLCFTVLTVDPVTPDERIPELAVKQVKFLVVQGLAEDNSFQPTTCKLNISAMNTSALPYLIETDDDNSDQGAEEA